MAIREVQEAFANAVLARGERVTDQTYDDEGTSSTFEGRRWQEVKPHELAMVTACLWHLTPSAVCAYLPAFLVASLESPSSGIADATIQFITPPKGNPRRPSFAAWWLHLSSRQQFAVVAFLREMSESALGEHAETLAELEKACTAS
ncbi:DUF6714 family protein [Atopomonas hussainii]|uniref:DUF6714 family protein n=1 Tax=Atopomonas hussainii TaxID=1429083 RepID=UPI001114B627|nr:DUF6714 family protein [Atopomonas hussainii]